MRSLYSENVIILEKQDGAFISRRVYLESVALRLVKRTFSSPSTDWDPDLLPADVATEAALPGSEEQDLHWGSAAVLHGHGAAGPQHHLLPHELGHAVQEGTGRSLRWTVLFISSSKTEQSTTVLIILLDVAVMMIDHSY